MDWCCCCTWQHWRASASCLPHNLQAEECIGSILLPRLRVVHCRPVALDGDARGLLGGLVLGDGGGDEFGVLAGGLHRRLVLGERDDALLLLGQDCLLGGGGGRARLVPDALQVGDALVDARRRGLHRRVQLLQPDGGVAQRCGRGGAHFSSCCWGGRLPGLPKLGNPARSACCSFLSMATTDVAHSAAACTHAHTPAHSSSDAVRSPQIRIASTSTPRYLMRPRHPHSRSVAAVAFWHTSWDAGVRARWQSQLFT